MLYIDMQNDKYMKIKKYIIYTRTYLFIVVNSN
jgi:hypothetical protein